MSEHSEQYDKIFIRLSGHFLSEHLPDNFFEMDDDEQMGYISEFVWQPFEYHSPEDVYGLIDALTWDVQNILTKGI